MFETKAQRVGPTMKLVLSATHAFNNIEDSNEAAAAAEPKIIIQQPSLNTLASESEQFSSSSNASNSCSDYIIRQSSLSHRCYKGRVSEAGNSSTLIETISASMEVETVLTATEQSFNSLADNRPYEIFENFQTNPRIVQLIYNGINVTRRPDSPFSVNVSHLLHLAGVEKNRASIFQEKFIKLKWNHEMMVSENQLLNGIWVSAQNALTLAREYNIESLIQKLINHGGSSSHQQETIQSVPVSDLDESKTKSLLQKKSRLNTKTKDHNASIFLAGPFLLKLVFKGIAVGKRTNSALNFNLSNMLTLAGVSTTKKNEILLKKCKRPEHDDFIFEKVRGGTASGTWVSASDGLRYARIFGVEELMTKFIDFDSSDLCPLDVAVDFVKNPGLQWLIPHSNRKSNLKTKDTDVLMNEDCSENTFGMLFEHVIQENEKEIREKIINETFMDENETIFVYPQFTLAFFKGFSTLFMERLIRLEINNFEAHCISRQQVFCFVSTLRNHGGLETEQV
ncbi:hypothetical protein HK100_000325 [Physocladia obscura]|uniref:HTH APSES-type domain-containing protein n=1 Tax=Physocladia obscura TaxID=109957 RepID=A0AAD5SZG5_9FUNG|nr:hypothetical protein HK100_000325 [Physocladia obscura]